MTIKIAQIKEFDIGFLGLKDKEKHKEIGLRVQPVPELKITFKFNDSLGIICNYNKSFDSIKGEELSNDWIMKTVYHFLDKTDSLSINDIINKYIKVDYLEDSKHVTRISHVLEEDWIEL